jgi:hypothetical protein
MGGSKALAGSGWQPQGFRMARTVQRQDPKGGHAAAKAYGPKEAEKAGNPLSRRGPADR